MPLPRAKIRELRGLALKKHRNKEGRFLIEGLRMAQEAVESDFIIVEAFHTDAFAGGEGGKQILQKLLRRNVSVERVTSRDISSVTDTVTAQGIVAVVRRKTFTAEQLLRSPEPQSVLVAFDAVADPGNLGSMIRTCDWFGVQGVMLGKNSVELYNPKVVRSTMGGIFHLRIAEDVDLLPAISQAKSVGYRVYVTDAKGETHFDRIQFSGRSLIVFGNEAWGVSDQIKQLADIRVAIRRYGAAESLNVGVACGIVLSSLHRLYDDSELTPRMPSAGGARKRGVG